MTTVYMEGHTKQTQVVTNGPYLSVSPENVRTKQQGTLIMGLPVDPKVHIDHREAAMGTVIDHQKYLQQNPYIQYSIVNPKPVYNPMSNVMNTFNQWSKKADTTSRDLWHNLKLGPSVSEAAYGKITLTAKAINEGGFESLFKHSFDTNGNEKLKKWFVCYLSTTTGLVSGTLYLSTAHAAFCRDRALLCKGPPEQGTYSYYKIMIPLASIGKVNAVIMKDKPQGPQEKYIQIMAVDGHDFWFMGFVSFEKATQHLSKIAPQTHSYGFNRQSH